MDLTRWPTLKSDWLYSLQPKWRSSIQSAKRTLGAACGSDHEFLIAKFSLKLKKLGKTTRPFRYHQNQISCDYTVEVTNRSRRLDLIDRVSEELWRTMEGGLWHCTGGRDQDHSQEKERQKGKIVVWGGLTNSCEKNRSENQRRKGKIYPFECRAPKMSKER